MSRTVVVQKWCDGEHDEPAEATAERVVAVDGGRPVLLDLCAEHDKFIEDLTVLMASGVDAAAAEPPTQVVRRPRGGRPPKEGANVNRTCPICGFTSASRGALGQHLQHRHQTNLRGANA